MTKDIKIKNNLYREIENYCNSNDIGDVEKFITDIIIEKFTSIKYEGIKTQKPEVEKVKPEPPKEVVEEKPIEPEIKTEEPKQEVKKPVIVKNKSNNNDNYNNIYD